jgi:hypothetical protein
MKSRVTRVEDHKLDNGHPLTVATLDIGFQELLTLNQALPGPTRCPTLHVVAHVHNTILAVTMAATPLALVLIGTLRRLQLAIPGWTLLTILVLFLFPK